MQYRAEIDGLRALAVLPVILFHAGFEWFSGGFVGVDVFFVISGYLITTIIISEMAEGKFSIVNFYERRARRILPALFFVMAACLPFAWLWLTPNDLKDFGQSLVAVSTFSSNILFWLESGYFDTAAELKPLLHTWSLAVEEQYYILFPIFLMLTWQLGVKWVLILLSVVFLLSLGVAQWGAYNKPSAAFFLLPTRGWELLVGVFAAFYLKYNTHLKSLFLNQILSLLGFGMITYSIIAFDKTTPFPSLYALIPTIGTGLLILCAVPKTFVYKLLSLKFIVGIGLISYSAYLWHQPLLAFARNKVLGDVAELHLIILCITSLLMAWFSWRFVEKPFRNKNQTTRKFILSYACMGQVIFSLIGVFFFIKDGSFENTVSVNPSINKGNIGPNNFMSYMEVNSVLCKDKELIKNAEIWGGFIRCKQTSQQQPSIALFGNSHAEHLFVGLAASLKEDLVYLTYVGGPFVGSKNHSYLINHIINNKEIDTVIYSFDWPYYYALLGEKVFKEKVRRTLLEFNRANKKLILVSSSPIFTFDAKHCYYYLKFNQSKNKCSISLSEFESSRSYFPVIKQLTNELNIELLDPSVLFCNQLECNMIQNNTILYRDNNHFNIDGSIMVGRFIAEESVLLK